MCCCGNLKVQMIRILLLQPQTWYQDEGQSFQKVCPLPYPKSSCPPCFDLWFACS